MPEEVRDFLQLDYDSPIMVEVETAAGERHVSRTSFRSGTEVYGEEFAFIGPNQLITITVRPAIAITE